MGDIGAGQADEIVRFIHPALPEVAMVFYNANTATV